MKKIIRIALPALAVFFLNAESLWAGKAELTDKSKKNIASIDNGKVTAADGSVLYTVVGQKLFKGVDTSQAALLYTLGDGKLMEKQSKGIPVYDKATKKVLYTVNYGQFYLGEPPSFQDFDYMMGFFTEEKKGAFKVKDKLLGSGIGEVKAENLTQGEYLAVFLVYMTKNELDKKAAEKIKLAKERASAAQREQAQPSSSSSPSASSSGDDSGLVKVNFNNECGETAYYCLEQPGQGKGTYRVNSRTNEEKDVYIGTKVYLSDGNGCTTYITTITRDHYRKNISICSGH